MASDMFLRLPDEKRAKVKQALLDEFSEHTLMDAQVARIVKKAGIARGAFYKYFDDLTDAYWWLVSSVLDELGFTEEKHFGRGKSVDDYVEQMQDLLERVDNSPYEKLMQLHYKANEGILEDWSRSHLHAVPSVPWILMTLSHETMKEALLDKGHREEIMKRYRQALNQIMGG